MGSRGPAGKPVELKVLEGNRGHRPLNLDTIFRPRVGVPSPPKHLLPEGKKAWRRLSVELEQYNLISTVDRDSFGMLCQTIGRLEQIERALVARQKLLIDQNKDPTDAYMDTTPNGLQVQSALYQVLNKEQAKLHKLLENFGLRPDARAKVQTAIRQQLQLFEGGKPETPAPSATPPMEPGGFSDF